MMKRKDKRLHIHFSSNWGAWPLLRQVCPDYEDRYIYSYGDSVKSCDVLVVLDGLPVGLRKIKCSCKMTVLVLLESGGIDQTVNVELCEQFDIVCSYRNDLGLDENRFVEISCCAPWQIGVSKTKGGHISGTPMNWLELAGLVAEKKHRASTFSTTKKVTAMHNKRKELTTFIKNNASDIIDVVGGDVCFVEDKLEALQSYEYHIVLENFIQRGYFSEKLTDALLAECLVFYNGDPTIEKMFPGATIRIDSKEPWEVIEIVRTAMKRNEFEKRRIHIKDAKKKILNNLNIVSVISDVVTDRSSDLEEKLATVRVLGVKRYRWRLSGVVERLAGAGRRLMSK